MTSQDFPIDSPRPLTLSRVVDIGRRRKWRAFAIAVLTLVAAVTATYTLPGLYHSSATVLIEREVSEELVKATVTSELEARIQTIHQRITSRENLSRLITELNLYSHLRPAMTLDEVVEVMRRDIDLQLKDVARTMGGVMTISFNVGYTGRNPQLVAAVVNRLADSYVAENATSRERQASSTAAVLRDELAQAKRQLDAQERVTHSYTLTHTAELPQQLAANLSTLDRIQSEVSLNGERQLKLMDTRERLQQELAAGGPPVPALDSASPGARLAALRQQLSTLRRSFSDEYPDIKRVKDEIAAVEQELAAANRGSNKALQAPLDPVATQRQTLQEVNSELSLLKTEGTNLRHRIAQYEGMVGSAPRHQVEMDRLMRDYDQAKQRYEQLQKQFEDARVAATLEEGGQVEHFRILDAAIPPRAPSAPNRQMLLLLGLGGAIILAAAAVMLSENLDGTLHSPDDLRDLIAGPAIVPLRRILTKRVRRRTWLRATAATLAFVLAVGVVATATYWVADDNERIVRLTLRGGA
jgi:polysaccharide chain length determinant protein (PEP-CTERM system associated)